MNLAASNDWLAANQRHLMGALAQVRHALERHAEDRNPKSEIRNPKEARSSKSENLSSEQSGVSSSNAEPAIRPSDFGLLSDFGFRSSDLQNPISAEAASAPDSPSSLQTLCAAFGLSPFERDVLLLCAGRELDGSFAASCAAAQGDPRRDHPTFSLALAALPGAHWSALLPSAPLRRWRLVETGSADVLTSAPLRIDERALHFLTGVHSLDERLQAIIRPVASGDPLPPSQLALARRIAEAWSRTTPDGTQPIVQLCGTDSDDARAIAAAACALGGLRLQRLQAADLPTPPLERDSLARLWEREAVLSRSALLVEAVESADAERTRALTAFLESLRALVFVIRRDPLELPARPSMRFDVPQPSALEQKALWAESLGADATALNGQLDRLIGQFSLGAQSIRAVGAEVLRDFAPVGGASVPASRSEPPHAPAREDGHPPESARPGHRDHRMSASPGSLQEPVSSARSCGQDGHSPARKDARPTEQLETRLWLACRARTRPRLDELAQRIPPAAQWDDLVLPAEPRQTLRDIAAQVRHRFKVYETWGFAGRGARCLGITALFSGPSGTGKTMAAEVLANELQLDLYRIDLSAVVSKYIGETEKNLRRIFDAAEGSGVILLFDEADSLFGKRSEVKDSHDRYANIEVSYLLQRMEAYRGLAVLTTNFQSALDTAFLRRIRFVVQFPFPDAAQRAEIWRRIFPALTPTESLDAGRLALLSVPGGNIRNIALNAAFLAADENTPVRMAHVRRAARAEYAKLEKPLTETETKGWL